MNKKDFFYIAKRKYLSRLIVGTGKYKNMKECAKAVKASGADIVTVAVRRVNIADKNKPVRDVSSQMMMAEIFSQRLSKLQEKDPKKKIEDIYKNSPNVLATVERLRKGVESANSVLKNTPNRSSFTFVPLSGSVPSEKSILKEVANVSV